MQSFSYKKKTNSGQLCKKWLVELLHRGLKMILKKIQANDNVVILSLWLERCEWLNCGTFSNLCALCKCLHEFSCIVEITIAAATWYNQQQSCWISVKFHRNYCSWSFYFKSPYHHYVDSDYFDHHFNFKTIIHAEHVSECGSYYYDTGVTKMEYMIWYK